MIYIEYVEYGSAVSDFEYKMWLENIKNILKAVDNGEMKYDSRFSVSTSVPISAVRLAICKGEIDNAHVAFIYKNKVFQADKNGRIADWPKGFADAEGELAFKILTHQAKARRTSNKP